MEPYICPSCFYETARKSNIHNHFSRKNSCAQKEGGVPLTDEIKEHVLSRAYTAVTTTNINNTNINNTNTTNININLSLCDGNPLTNEVLQNLLLPHLNVSKYQQEKVFKRLGRYHEKHVEKDQDIEHKDVLEMADVLTKTTDHRKLSDAYYGYHDKNSYVKRDDNEIWKWRPCRFEDILADTIDQMQEYVFNQYEVKLNNLYSFEGDKEPLDGFYKLNKYLLIRPMCCKARHDNQLLFEKNNSGFDRITPSIDLCEELNDQFDVTPIDNEVMKKFRLDLEALIRTNAESTYKIIENLIRNNNVTRINL